MPHHIAMLAVAKEGLSEFMDARLNQCDLKENV